MAGAAFTKVAHHTVGAAVFKIGRVIVVSDAHTRGSVVIPRVLEPQRMANFMRQRLTAIFVFMDQVIGEHIACGVVPGLPSHRWGGIGVIGEGIGAA
ncbi:hypothetical protein D3C72_1383670 [compost metagenome]